MRVSWTKAAYLGSLLASSASALYIDKPALQTRDLNALVTRDIPQDWEGFDQSKAGDKQKVQQITQAFRDMDTMVSRVLKALTAKDSNDEAQSWDKQTALIVLGNYFSPDKKTAGGPTQKEIVIDVLTNMVDPPGKTPGTGSAMFVAMTIGNGLNEDSCSAGTNADGKPSTVAAYTVSGGNCGTSIYFCDNDRVNPFKYPDLGQLPMDAAQCKKVFKDGKVSYKMAPLAYILIHELTHTLEVSELPFKKAKVTDKLKATDDPAYGPQNVRALRDKPEHGKYAATKDLLLGPIENADSYAWFVVEAYFSLLCHERFGAPASNQMAPDGVCSNGPDKCTLM